MQNKRSSMHFRTTRLCSIWERPKFWEKLQFFEKFFLVILGQKLLFSSDFLSKLYFNLLLTIFYRFRSKISIFRANDMHLGAKRYFTKKTHEISRRKLQFFNSGWISKKNNWFLWFYWKLYEIKSELLTTILDLDRT